MLSSELKTPDVYPIDAKNVVIAGAGPVGLVIAIMLAQQKVNVTLVDSWMGECTRAHELPPEVLKTIAQAIAPLKIYFDSAKLKEISATKDFDSSNHKSMQLKDIEKQLFEHVKNLKVHLIKKQFHSFEDKHKILLTEKNASPTAEKTELTEVDLFIDCTGEKRVGLRKYNDKRSDSTSSQFVFKQLTEDQEPFSFAHMRVISKEDTFKNFESRETPKNLEQFFLLKEKLDDLGWKEARLPETVAWFRPKKNTSFVKNHLYMEIPKEYLDKDKKIVSQSDLTSYAKLLSQLTSNQTEVEFEFQPTSKTNKNMSAIFTADPKQTTPAFMLGNDNFPFIAHMGDASSSLLFLTAMSLAQGVLASHTIISKFFIITEGVIKTIRTKDWLDFYNQHLDENIKFMTSIYDKIKENRAAQKKEFKDIYFSAYLRFDNPLIRDRIVKEYKKISPHDSLPSKVFNHLFSLVEKDVVEEKDIRYPNMLKRSLDKSFNYLETLNKMHGNLSVKEQETIKQIWKNLATSYDNLGNFFTSTVEKTYCYEKALKIHEFYLKSIEKASLLVDKLQAPHSPEIVLAKSSFQPFTSPY